MTSSVPRVADRETPAMFPAPDTDLRQPELESSQLNYYARYFGDPVSRLFWAGNKLQLGILPGYGQNFSDLLDREQLETKPPLASARRAADLCQNE